MIAQTGVEIESCCASKAASRVTIRAVVATRKAYLVGGIEDRWARRQAAASIQEKVGDTSQTDCCRTARRAVVGADYASIRGEIGVIPTWTSRVADIG